MFCSVDELTTALEEWIKLWNEGARPGVLNILLFGIGVAFICGGLRHGSMGIDVEDAQNTCMLMVFTLVLPAVAVHLRTSAEHLAQGPRAWPWRSISASARRPAGASSARPLVALIRAGATFTENSSKGPAANRAGSRLKILIHWS